MEMKNELNLKALIAAMLKHILWLILIPLVCACVMFAVTSFKESTYTTTVTCFSRNPANSIDYLHTTVISAQQAKITDYINVLKSDATLSRVSQKLSTEYGLKVTVSELKGMISAAQTEGSAEFKIMITTSDAKLSESIGRSVADVYSPIIDELEEREGLIEVLSKEFAATENKPDFVKLSLIAAAVGFILTFAVCFFLAYNDKTIRTADEAKKCLDIPVVGVIPH